MLDYSWKHVQTKLNQAYRRGLTNPRMQIYINFPPTTSLPIIKVVFINSSF